MRGVRAISTTETRRGKAASFQLSALGVGRRLLIWRLPGRSSAESSRPAKKRKIRSTEEHEVKTGEHGAGGEHRGAVDSGAEDAPATRLPGPSGPYHAGVHPKAACPPRCASSPALRVSVVSAMKGSLRDRYVSVVYSFCTALSASPRQQSPQLSPLPPRSPVSTLRFLPQRLSVSAVKSSSP